MCPAKKTSTAKVNGKEVRRAEPRVYIDAEEVRRQRFAAMVRDIERKFGYIAATVPPPRENPYANMTPEQSRRISIEAGIIAKSGKLGKRYR